MNDCTLVALPVSYHMFCFAFILPRLFINLRLDNKTMDLL